MATGAKKGLNPSRKKGSAPDNKGLSEYTIASAYATDLGLGDLVQVAADGSIQQGTNGGAYNIGGYFGVRYTDTAGDIKEQQRWPASTVATDAVAKVMDGKDTLYKVVADGAITNTDIGDNLPVRFNTTVDSTIGRSNMEVRVLAQVTATAIDFTGETDIGANTAISDTDAFTVDTSTVASATTITFDDGDGIVEFLAKLNAVTGISGEISEDGSTSGFLTIKATDGSQLRLDDTVGTPLVDMGIIATGVTVGLRIDPHVQWAENRLTATAIDFRGETDIGANTAITDADAFIVTPFDFNNKVEAVESLVITINNGDGTAEFLEFINAMQFVTATLEEGTGFLVLEAPAGYDIELTESVGTPLADMGFFVGRTRKDRSAVRVTDIVDTTNNVLEVEVL